MEKDALQTRLAAMPDSELAALEQSVRGLCKTIPSSEKDLKLHKNLLDTLSVLIVERTIRKWTLVTHGYEMRNIEEAHIYFKKGE